jgi:hypothetical protein
MAKKTLKHPAPTNRVEEIEAIQESIRRLADAYSKDFTEPDPMGSLVQKDLKTAADSLDLLKNIYKAKTEKK